MHISISVTPAPVPEKTVPKLLDELGEGMQLKPEEAGAFDKGNYMREFPNKVPVPFKPKPDFSMIKCYNCQGWGHFAKYCKNPKVERTFKGQKMFDPTKKCYNCNQIGHIAMACPRSTHNKTRRTPSRSSYKFFKSYKK